ncbi:hypothetical protein VNO77_08204 [Canavalia gladiata]|uniref:Uncharacterized protein n=1 Tax=Canavalia gladiata TaxID=3824 RepID=A0AAN9M9X3_CANGL
MIIDSKNSKRKHSCLGELLAKRASSWRKIASDVRVEIRYSQKEASSSSLVYGSKTGTSQGDQYLILQVMPPPFFLVDRFTSLGSHKTSLRIRLGKIRNKPAPAIGSLARQEIKSIIESLGKELKWFPVCTSMKQVLKVMIEVFPIRIPTVVELLVENHPCIQP